MSVALAKSDNLIAFPQPQSKSNEWYTPSKYIEAARKVMGGIDLDPASCEVANRTVRAKRYYTQADNGLVQPWYGNVWLNPPYGRDNTQPNGRKSTIARWVETLIKHCREGNVKQFILLVTARTDAAWFNLLWDYFLCFSNHHIAFNRTYGTPAHPNRFVSWQMHGSIFVYFGPNEQLFIEVFSQFGRIAKAIDTPKVQPINLSLWEVQS